MKKLTLISILAIMSLTFVNAQFTKIGGGLGYTTGYYFHDMSYEENKSGHFNFFAKGIYEITLPLHISPSITYYFPHKTVLGDIISSSTYTVSTLVFDINGHYVFNSLDRFEFYGLAGMEILLAWKKDVLTGSASSQTFKESDNAIGLNLGAGTYMKLTDQLDLSLEAKYVVSKYGQFMISAGVLINIDWLKKNEDPGL
jgi:opacity protein-like surface antigen